MKLSGAGIIWICLTLTGLRISELLKRRVKLLEETESFIESMKIELRYRGDVLFNILERASLLSSCHTLDYLTLCCKNLKAGADFPLAWKKALKESKAPYTAEEKKKLASLGEILGTTDIDSQITMLNLYGEYVRAFLKKAQKTEESYSRLSCVVGFLMGFAVFILVV